MSKYEHLVFPCPCFNFTIVLFDWRTNFPTLTLLYQNAIFAEHAKYLSFKINKFRKKIIIKKTNHVFHLYHKITFRVSIVCDEAALGTEGHWSRVQMTAIKDIYRMFYHCLKSPFTAIIFLAIQTQTYMDI